MAQHPTTAARRVAMSVAMCLGTIAAAASLTSIVAGTAAADTLVPDPSVAGNGNEADGAVRESATDGEMRAADMGEVLAPAGTGGTRASNKAVPSTKAWVFSGAAGDISACVYDGPWCANWMAIPFDLNNPG